MLPAHPISLEDLRFSSDRLIEQSPRENMTVHSDIKVPAPPSPNIIRANLTDIPEEQNRKDTGRGLPNIYLQVLWMIDCLNLTKNLTN